MKSIFFSVLLLSLPVISACGSGGGGGLTGSYKVTDVNILADDIAVGEAVRVDVFFDTKIDIISEPDGLDVVAELSPEIEYETGSSAIYDQSEDDTDPRTPDDVLHCPDGRTFLVYAFSDDELEGRSLSGGGNFGLRFQVEGKTSTASAKVRAAASDNQSYSCDGPFNAEKDETVKVL